MGPPIPFSLNYVLALVGFGAAIRMWVGKTSLFVDKEPPRLSHPLSVTAKYRSSIGSRACFPLCGKDSIVEGW